MRAISLFILVVLLTSIALTLKAQTLQQYYTEAMASFRKKDYARFYEQIHAAHQLNSTHQGILYQLGVAEVLTKRTDEGLRHLRRALLIDATFRLDTDAFEAVRAQPAFQALLKLQQELQQPVVQSSVFLTVKDRTLHAEGIAHDPSTGDFFIGSIRQRKVVRIASNGAVSDLIPAETGGMAAVFGLQYDADHKWVWACSSPIDEMQHNDSTVRSGVYALAASTGKIERTYRLPLAAPQAIFGDLILDKRGNALVSDSRNNIIYRTSGDKPELQQFFSSPDFVNIQGLAYSPDERFLFIADYVKGIFRLEIRTMTATLIATEPEVSLKGTDGLYFYQQSLIAIQNGVSPFRVTRYRLNKTFDTIASYEVLDRAHPDFGEPTLGVIARGNLYYIANSQWNGYDANHQPKPADQLKDIVILRHALK